MFGRRTGSAATNRRIVSLLHPFESVTSTQYIPGSFTVIEGDFSPEDHSYRLYGLLAFNVVLSPRQKGSFEGMIVATGNGIGIIVMNGDTPEQPFTSVTFT